jgi:dATP pyrophosphohydrolase
LKPFKIPESVLVVIHTPQLDVLLIERADNPGFWQSVTGSKDTADEPLLQTAVREVLEETGIDAAPGQFRDWGLANVYEIYPVWRHRYAPGVTRNTEHVFSLCLPQARDVKLTPGSTPPRNGCRTTRPPTSAFRPRTLRPCFSCRNSWLER